MTVASVLVGIGIVVVVFAAAFVVIRDSRKGNHCASCRGCAMGCRDKDILCSQCAIDDEEKEKEE